MKPRHRWILIFILAAFSRLTAQQSNIFTGCASDQFFLRDPSLIQRQQTLDLAAYQYLASQKNFRTTSTVALIPTVVHIVHNGGPENISNAQVIAAINDINSKLLANNNYQVQLCLAQRDLQNNATTGITRDSSLLTSDTMETTDLSLKNINRWNPYCYLNIWIVKDITSISMGNGVIGYSTFPASHGQNTDGLVIEANYFGSSTINDCVGTHELGHYLGLYHTFQNACTNNNCLLDGDQVCDTPPDQTTFAVCNPAANSCNTDTNDPSANNPFTTDVPDLSDDYMDYSNLTCYTQFTPGQHDRMQYFLSNVRSSLLGCLSCSSPCPTPITANITSPATNINVNVGTSVTFTGTASGSTSYEWYLVSGGTLSSTTGTIYTFNAVGTFWMKFRAISSNPATCLDGIDSVQINVLQPAVASCGGSLEFLNSNDAVLLPTPAGGQYYHNNNGFTWECWVKLTAPFGSYSNALLRNMICSVDPSVYEDICLSFGWSGGMGNVPFNMLCFKVDGNNGPSGTSCSYVPSGGFILGTWYHVAGTMDYVNHVTKLYCNGALVDTKTNNATPFNRAIPTQLSWDVVVNPGYSNPPLGGNLDEVRIWSKVRTPTEIATYYNQCLAGNEQNLMLYYRCDQTAGTLATDASPNGYNGTLTHQTAWSTQQCNVTGSNCSPGCGGSCPVIKASNDTIICPGSVAQLNSSSGFISYTWTPSTGLNNAGIANPTASPASTTTYVVSGSSTDTSGQACTSVDTVIVKVVAHAAPVLNLGPDITLCANGTQVFNAGAGFAHYQWSDGDVTQTTTVYGPGKYWVTATDSCGGTQTDTVLVTLASTPILQLGPDTMICLGSNVTLTAYPLGTFSSFVWTPNIGLSCSTCSATVASPPDTTQYILTASTSQGCTTSDTITVNVLIHMVPALNLGADIVFCNSGTHTFDAGQGFTHYQWSNGNTTQTLTVNAPGNYWVTTTDSCGGLHSDTVAVFLDIVPTLNAGIDTTICLGTSTMLSATPSGAFTSFNWNPNAALSCDTCPATTASPSVTTQYILTAGTTHGCTIADTVTVFVDQNIPTSVLLDTTDPTCTQNNGAIQIAAINGGTPVYQFDLSGVGATSDSAYVGLAAGSYTLTVTDNAGCLLKTPVLLTDHPGPSGVLITTTDASVCEANGSAFIANVTGGTAPFLYSFNSGNFTPAVYYPGINAGTYTLVVKDSNNCLYTSAFTIYVIPETEEILIPNCFTPNGDTLNETWFIKGKCVQQLECAIYDRWGVQMRSFSSLTDSWDGTYSGKAVPDGIYFYVVRIVFDSGKTFNAAGPIQLIR